METRVSGTFPAAQFEEVVHSLRVKWVVAEISGKEKSPGSDLFSHAIANAVSSALKRFTAVFEMGTGGAASLQPPGGYASSIKRPKKQCQREFDA